MRTIMTGAGLLLALGTLSPAHAAGAMPKAKIDYSAEGTLKTQGMTIDAKVYYTPEKERREHQMQGVSQVVIVRHDRKLVWMLMPMQKMYMEVDIKQGQGMMGELPVDAKVERTKVGEETVNGEKTTKFKTTIKQGKDAQMDGFMWVTADDIIMKMDATASGHGQKMTFSMELRNLKKGKQDASLFELPSGFTKLPSAGLDPETLKRMGGAPAPGTAP